MAALAEQPDNVGVAELATLLSEDGLSFVQGMIAGRHPRAPYGVTMGIDLEEAEAGRVVFIGNPSAAFLNPVGTIQGGWASTILDAAMAHCVHTLLKRGESYTSLEMKINFVRPVRPASGSLRCEGNVIHRGRRTATSEGRLVDVQGNLIAHGTETCIIFPSE
jgi:uncharacterized protein (TIGR00369 family)